MNSTGECLKDRKPDHDHVPTAIITAAAYARLLALCEAKLPDEACGVLTADQSDAPHGAIDGVLPIRNVAASPTLAFRFHPNDWIMTYYAAQKNRQSIVGFFHSHPNASPIPSPSDESGWLELSGHGPFTYWIVSVWGNAEQPACRAYRRSLRSDGSSMFAQVSIQVT